MTFLFNKFGGFNLIFFGEFGIFSYTFFGLATLLVLNIYAQ